MRRILLILNAMLLFRFVCAGSVSGSLRLRILDSSDSQALQGAVVIVHPYELWSQSDKSGKVTINNVPRGRCTLEISLLGYVTKTLPVIVSDDMDELRVKLDVQSYSLNNVVVTSRRTESPGSTTTRIEAQAIAHLQATSLSDVLQLLPGEVVSSNPTLTKESRFQSRSLDPNDGNNSFGSALVIDGIPVSTNAERANTGGTLSSSGTGVDLRSIGTDNIESLDIIRCIPSVEYGDLTSGTMIVKSKTGVSDLRGGVRIYPGIYQANLGKGIKLGDRHTLNLSADFADGKSDPRYRTDTYTRTGFTAAHTANLKSGSVLTTRLRYGYVKDWSGPDPDEPVQDVWAQTVEHSVSLSHTGRFSGTALLARNFGYDLSLSFKNSESDSRKLLSGNHPLMNSTQDGTFGTVMLPLQYYASGGTLSRPVNLFAKVFDKFTITVGEMSNNFNLGAEYRIDGNFGYGFRNDDPSLPLSEGAERWRPYNELPFLHQAIAYVEDSFRLPFVKGREYPMLAGQVGLRATLLQPHRSERLASLSPRINLSLSPNRFLRLRAGYGVTDKMPSQTMLYPDRTFVDVVNISAMRSDQYLGLYTTCIYPSFISDVQPMRTRKAEAGIEFRTESGRSFAVTAYWEKTDGGFGSSVSEITPVIYPYWQASDTFMDEGGKLSYNPSVPSRTDTLANRRSVPSNSNYNSTWGVEFDFDLGRIAATGTSFFLNGAYLETQYHSLNPILSIPRGKVESPVRTYLSYPADCNDNLRRRFSSTLRIVQGLPALSMVISAAIQATFYEYTKYTNTLLAPTGFWAPDGSGEIVYTAFTAEQIANPSSVSFRGYSLADQINEPSAYSGVPEVWPPLWSVSLRASKNLTKYLDLSFHVNNLFFHQPWQKSSVGTQEVERNGNLFAFGFEISVHF